MNDKTQSGKTDPGQASGEGTETQKSVSDLLDEWQAGDKAVDESGKAPSDDFIGRLSAIERAMADDAYKKEMASVVTEVRGDLNVPDLVVEAWVNEQADKDTRLNDLYKDRDNRKGEWEKAVNALKPEFAKFIETEFGIKAGAGKDRPAQQRLGAAVRAAKGSDETSGEDFDDVDWGGLSDMDFQLKKSEVFRQAKAGAFSSQ